MSKVTIKTDFGLSKNLNKIRRSFKRQSCPLYEKTIKRDIAAGVSPVRGQRLFKKYSQSYKDGIRGKVKFRTINGRVHGAGPWAAGRHAVASAATRPLSCPSPGAGGPWWRGPRA